MDKASRVVPSIIAWRLSQNFNGACGAVQSSLVGARMQMLAKGSGLLIFDSEFPRCGSLYRCKELGRDLCPPVGDLVVVDH
jgi:hypothetical protein